MCIHPFHNKRSLNVAELTGKKPQGSPIKNKQTNQPTKKTPNQNKNLVRLPEAFPILYPRDASCDHKHCRIYMELLLAQMKRMADGYQKSCAFAAWIASCMQSHLNIDSIQQGESRTSCLFFLAEEIYD